MVASPFQLDLACQVFLACVGALSLMLLTGYAGQISLGHAGLMAAGAFTVGILFRETNAPFWITLPAAALVGALLGIIFGLPSLRLRGLYLAVSTLALHFVVIYLGGEYETQARLLHRHRHRSAALGGVAITDGRAWYFVLLVAAAPTLLALPQSPAQRAPAAPGARSARMRPWPRRSASASPATSCSPS